MEKIISFQRFIIELLAVQLPKLNLSELEVLGSQVAIYSYFENNNSLEKIYFEILDYCDENEKLSVLLPKIEDFYSQTLDS